MNKQRRKELDGIRTRLEGLKEELEFLREQEQEAFENMPQSFQDGERGVRITNGIEYMEFAYRDLETALESLNAEELGGLG